MEQAPVGFQEIPRSQMYPSVGRTALELLAQPVEARNPGPTPPTPIETAARPTPPDHTGYPDVSPPDQEYLYE
jgi:hypothetical protein